MEKEKWTPVPEYETQYHISNLGRVKSLPRFKGSGRGYWTKERILIPQ